MRVQEGSMGLWVQSRESNDELRGLWEFPGGKIEKGESPEDAALRETWEEAKVKVPRDKIIRFGQYQFPPLMIFVHVYMDERGLFQESGYIALNDLLANKARIPPNNIVILENFLRDFRHLNV